MKDCVIKIDKNKNLTVLSEHGSYSEAKKELLNISFSFIDNGNVKIFGNRAFELTNKGKRSRAVYKNRDGKSFTYNGDFYMALDKYDKTISILESMDIPFFRAV
jgi:hypothetical protein